MVVYEMVTKYLRTQNSKVNARYINYPATTIYEPVLEYNKHVSRLNHPVGKTNYEQL